MLLCVGNACAQTDKTFCFVDADGNEVADGSTITIYAEEEEMVPGMPELGVVVQAKYPLSVKNNTDATATVALKVVAPFMPKSGGVQVCFPMMCDNHDRGTFTTMAGDLEANEVRNINSEWIFDDGTYYEANVTLTILAGTSQVEGPSVKVKSVYADPTGIADLEADRNAKAVGFYGANGAKMSAPQKGLNIVKMSNGKTKKVVVNK